MAPEMRSFRTLPLALVIAIQAASAATVAWAVPTAARAEERLAVLEFSGPQASDELRRALAERARAAALVPARARGITVMTREAITLVLQEMGGKCAEGECEIEAARNVGASMVMTGEVRRLSETWLVDLRLHETAKGALLAAENVSAANELALLEVTFVAARRLLGGPDAVNAPSAAGPERPAGPWYGEARFALGWPVGYETTNVDPCVDSLSSGLCAAPFVSVRAGRRLAQAWAVEGALGFLSIARSSDAGFADTKGYFVAVAGSWTSARVPWAGAGVELGVQKATANAEVGTVVASQGSLRPMATVELRLDRRLGAIQWGLRAGLTFVAPGKGVFVDGGAGGTLSASGGAFVLPTIGVSGRYGP
jgi:hypothetical protein